MAQGKKNAARLGAHLVFCDESGFLLIPNAVRTWAPRGQTPLIEHPYRRDKVSVISGISVSPIRQRLELYYLFFLDNIGHVEVCLFLQHLLRHLRGPVIALLDNARIHKGSPIELLKNRHPRLTIEYFPSYAPEVNPDEGVWSLAKRRLGNGCPSDIEELISNLGTEMSRIRHSQSNLRWCIHQSELPFSLH